MRTAFDALFRVRAWGILAVFFLSAAAPQAASPQPEARTLIALYDSRHEPFPHSTRLHQFWEMPANHLGLTLEYHDIHQSLPDLTDRPDVRGVISWFLPETRHEDTYAFLEWAQNVSDAGKRYLLIGSLGEPDTFREEPGGMAALNAFYRRLGVNDHGYWEELSYKVRIDSMNPELIGFERQLPPLLPPFEERTVITPDVTSHLRLAWTRTPGRTSDIVVTGPAGGIIQEGYVYYTGPQYTARQWYIDPFDFLRLALATDTLPKPDTTTLLGRRIFYSHIDGDGWNNVTHIEGHREHYRLSSEVILREIIRPYDDLPVTVGVIVSDIDRSCYGFPDSERIAREILAQPHVEAGSHTYSHPLYWRFFADGNPAREVPYLDKYPPMPTHGSDKSSTLLETVIPQKPVTKHWGLPDAHPTTHYHGTPDENEPLDTHGLPLSYETPRSAACEPFSLEKEVAGSIEYINSLAPEGKTVQVYQWSGDTSPFEAAVAATRDAGVRNINGGDARFDAEYPSYAWVSPIGRQVGNERQIYASNSNENTYTNLWRERFFGFRHLVKTAMNTESPLRIKPFNVYYHMYSGEKPASLKAVKDNLSFARRHNVIPITTSNYTRIADGFYSTRLVPVESDVWRVEDRDGLQTIRFDEALNRQVNFMRSRGVIGQRHFQGSLYVALDPDVETPVIALKNHTPNAPITPFAPYVEESAWNIRGVEISGGELRFTAQGFGLGPMRLRMPESGPYRITVTEADGTTWTSQHETWEHGELSFLPWVGAITPVKIVIQPGLTPRHASTTPEVTIQ